MRDRIVATLNLDNAQHRFMLDVIQRMHSGRSPLFRALAMRRDGDTIIEAAELLPRRKTRRYTVVRWNLSELGLTWRDQPSREAALTALLGPSASLAHRR